MEDIIYNILNFLGIIEEDTDF